jgi:hypothetical protein
MSLKLCIGPMSKLVVDAVLELDEKERNTIAFIPSRRQVEFSGGYVSNWTTKQFSDYVDKKVKIQRDHGGPGQGNNDDDGYESFEEDARCLDLIHVDPWKKYQNYDDGLDQTIESINHIYNLNPDIQFEVGTEESIRRFETEEFGKLLQDLKGNLDVEVFKAIKYGVVQSGVGLDLLNMKNTGEFSAKRLEEMNKICHNFGLLSKEHNGDYLTKQEIQQRFDLGLDTINIAPEFGQIETLCYIEALSDSDLKKFYDICYNSKRWEKWISTGETKDIKKLIQVCGHYVFANKDFISFKPNLDELVKEKIKSRVLSIIS